MTVLAQGALFLSSFAPLFVVFALLDSFGRGWPTAVCALAALLGLVALPGCLKVAKRLGPQSLNIETAQARDGDVLAYIATYLVPFASIVATTGRQRTALGVFVVLIALLYVRAELFYINPLLAVVKYRLFQVSTPGGASVVLITHRRFVQPDVTIQARRLSDYVYWEARA